MPRNAAISLDEIEINQKNYDEKEELDASNLNGFDDCSAEGEGEGWSVKDRKRKATEELTKSEELLRTVLWRRRLEPYCEDGSV